MEVNEQDFCLLVLPSITRALYKIGQKNAALGFAAFKMLNDYAMTGEEPQGVDDDLTLSILFETIAPIIDKCRENYQKSVNRYTACKENGKKGGRPKTQETEENLLQPKEEFAIFKRLNCDEEFCYQWRENSEFSQFADDEDFVNFYNECRAKNKRHTSETDIKSHFFDWLRIQAQNRKNEWKKGRYRC